ncbi:hypothetical protein RISK_002398 [Rhodopirellula islandica]|uniref:Uncharacterized protein n=1 Tax=Rhodopirellula islandica TaxID=595434 RepID=A0A0J1BGW2_RHOIS|nr:hypothetical protein RISK_002398 [Rhodopirellula islandica]
MFELAGIVNRSAVVSSSQEMDRELRLEGLGSGRRHGVLFDVVCFSRAIQWL